MRTYDPSTRRERGDLLPFLRAWASNPLRVAALAPSSVELGRLITRDISSATGPVLELGPGTGIFTRALLARGVAEENLTLVELGDEFAEMLELRFPRARLVRVDAARLGRALPASGDPFGAVVSGLPLLSMPPRKVHAILKGAFDRLRPDGAYYQFTYGVRCPVAAPILQKLDLSAVRIGTVLKNVPPAGVYRVTRRSGD